MSVPAANNGYYQGEIREDMPGWQPTGAVQSRTVQCSAVKCITMQCSAVQCSAVDMPEWHS